MDVRGDIEEEKGVGMENQSNIVWGLSAGDFFMPFHLPSCKLMGHFVLAPVIWFGFGGFQLGMPLPSLGFDCSTSCCCAWVELLSNLGQKIEVAFSAFPLA
ncbi:hypothetical protein POPTR_009G152101v4 [Populus trichocarpa]|uniref:Uncharacterized protein n=2 Tax=Populus trichocarpa TaxID=3694 RepID=A0ACC0SID3_POPTR|nr:hypothetical protein POPTR_009G152101v4 [Populus trichocarpa]KAI9389003.1 hypothetical protein POPTR_009G152101v4 [Populus trichocarpa]